MIDILLIEQWQFAAVVIQRARVSNVREQKRLDAAAASEEHPNPGELIHLKKDRAVARIEQVLNAPKKQLARKHFV